MSFILYLSLFDTGFSFSIHYLKTKSINDYRDNQSQIENDKFDIIDQNTNKNNFESIVGLLNKHKLNSKVSAKKIKPLDFNLKESEFNQWIRSNGGNFSNKFSKFNQINKDNLSNLNLLWKYENKNRLFLNSKWENTVQINPIFFDGIIYFTTPYKEIIAIDSLTGKLIWKFNSLKKIDSRGMTLWINNKNPSESCIFVPIRDTVFCINYKTGKKNNNFGKNGFVETGTVRGAPVIWKDTIIVATMDTLKVIGYSLPEGQKLWEIPIHPKEKKFKGGTPWGGISLDSKRNLLYVSTGNPRPAMYGGFRKGNNKNSNSIIAFDLIEKNIKWAFQEVSHDLWDFDIPSPPLLTSLKINDKIIDVVIVLTKIGNTLVFDRETGESIFDINYKKAPKSQVVNEITSHKQILINKPQPTIKFEFDINDLDKRNIKNQNLILDDIDNYTYGWFEPPSLDKTLLLYGLHGGAQWPGGVFDPYSQNLYIPVNQIPWKIRLYLTSSESYPKNYKEFYNIYKKNCSSCHGNTRNGVYKTEKEKEIEYIPSLININDNKYPNFNIFNSKIHKKHIKNFEIGDLKKIYKLFELWDRKIKKNNSYKINYQWSQLLYEDDLPATSPPWGKIVSLNLNNGKLNWQVPNGYIGSRKLGTSNFGGIVLTDGGVLFATGTEDNKIVALNSENGNELWSYEMDSAGSTSPMTFMWKNKQILIVVASGGKYHNYKNKSFNIYAFSIK
ncbi:PQQ-binding-like beta-propeller repeat protein [Alphaproteobacteria bacterium]|nr:PQQ-binding-like beta-propeller repeat protein [Alphaproteobacteria bacterium]